MSPRVVPWLRALLLAVALVMAATARGHDVAGQLRLHGFVQAEGERLRLVLRLPLELLLNVDLPKRGNGYLELAHVDGAVPRALQAVTKGVVMLEDGRPLAPAAGEARIALPDDRSFESFDKALAAVRHQRLPVTTEVYWNQGYFDALIEYRLRGGAAPPDLALDLQLAPGLRDRLRLDLRVLTPGGAVRAYDIGPGSGPVVLDPRWHQAAWSFTQSGMRHILGGVDHLLFLLCLVLPFRRLGWPLVGVVTAFTVAHSLTLALAALGEVPKDPAFAHAVEVLIAASILYVAIENLFAPSLARRWLLTAAFGLVHGLGFSFGLAQEMQFAGEHLVLSLLGFNLGVELGQLLVLALVLPLLAWLIAIRPASEKLVLAVLCGFVAHQSWHWLSERFEALARADWQGLVSWMWPHGVVAALLLVAVWLGLMGLRRPAVPRTPSP